ncbi:MAG: phosphoribosyltransferase domain-containing protein [Deinococcaceae bacterium]
MSVNGFTFWQTVFFQDTASGGFDQNRNALENNAGNDKEHTLAFSTHTQTHRVTLPTGTLSLNVDALDFPLEDLCGFASRANRKRGFLFVSKVLGKHIPVRPQTMAKVHRHLACKVASVLDNPQETCLFMGLAETATGLGQGIFDAWLEQTSNVASMFIQSTRYRLIQHAVLEFEESHSHASSHLIHLPRDPEARARFSKATTLVLIDDEMTTGNTLVHLAQSYLQHNPFLKRILVVTLTDWLGDHRGVFLDAMPRTTQILGLLSGASHWEPIECDVSAPPAHASLSDKTPYLGHNPARTGVMDTSQLSAEWTETHLGDLERTQTRLGRPARVLVLGSGEFSHLPFRLAQCFEREGHDVYFQTTTRSPILTGGAIVHKMEFVDNYFDGIPNYVYNCHPPDYDAIFVGYETPNLPKAHQNWLNLVGGTGVFF